MVRIVGVDLPPNKKIAVGLTYIYGIGDTLSRKIVEKTGINPSKKIKELNDTEVVALRDALKDYLIEGDLRREIAMDVKRLIDIGAYRGTRHRKGLPARGQRSRTNARTKRGKRKTVGAGKKKEEKRRE